MRPNKNQIASTTLEIMRGQGLKYVHAITDGRQGVEGDLEKSKRKIKRYNETVRPFLPVPPPISFEVSGFEGVFDCAITVTCGDKVEVKRGYTSKPF